MFITQLGFWRVDPAVWFFRSEKQGGPVWKKWRFVLSSAFRLGFVATS